MSRDLLDVACLEAKGCVACDLSQSRTNVVFGSGDPHSGLMLIGEAPGLDEDLSGIPFVGRSGRLVVTLLEEEFGLSRDRCYIANVVKCRPPANRNPRPVEIETCRHFLDAQISAVRPKLVMPLGNVATRSLLATTMGITVLRGNVTTREDYLILPTFHPAAALRSGRSVLDLMRTDFRLGANLLREMGEL